MATAISRDSFNELKNYLGVYLQQGRVILDSDWNENQDIAVSFLRRLSREALGEGSPNRGFAIDPVFPPPPALVSTANVPPGGDLNTAIGSLLGACLADFVTVLLYVMFGPLLFFLNFPGKKFEDFESADGWTVSSPQGVLRIGQDRPYEGHGFVRLSGHPGTVQIVKRLANVTDISAFEMATFHYRLNQQTPGTLKFFVEDDSANRSVWLCNNSAFARDLWLAGFAAPLDIRYRIVTDSLQPGSQNGGYGAQIYTFGGTAPITWSVSAGALPAGMTLGPSGTGDASRIAKFNGNPTAQGTFNFTVKAVDAANKTTTHDYALKIGPPSAGSSVFFPSPTDMLAKVAKVETPTGTPADLTRIRSYGFELYQDPQNPLVWDVDDLRLASSALESQIGNNNFIIRGSQYSEFIGQITLLTILQNSGGTTGTGGSSNPLQNLLDLMNTNFQLAEPSIENAGRYYVAGYPCVQVQDALYTDQADPNDPPLKPPAAGVVRKDLVYLDVWREPVTYVEDPEIREIALGGPDTTTRLRVRYRVRVAQGANNQPGALPADNGIGLGTLETEGSYTGQANRLYLIEIDTPGDIATATFRWSDDNASTIQRVIASIPPGTTKILVEDAAAFHPGDRILIRKQFGHEEHQVASVFGNAITLAAATGTQLAALPAAAVVPNFTTFSVDDRPKIQRWNAFRVPIGPDPKDSTTSTPIPLNDGVQVRFGGRAMKRGDYWNFKTRFLAGDQAAGINPDTRIEAISFQRARGVEHRYSPLAMLTRDGSDSHPDQIFSIQDRRQRVGNSSTVNSSLSDFVVTGIALAYMGGISLPPAAADSKFVVFFSADLFLPAPAPAGATMTVQVSFYNDAMTNPATDQKTGDIQDRTANVPLARRQANAAVPVNLIFSKSDTAFIFLPVSFVPTSVQVFVKLSGTGFSVQLSNIQVTVMEMKKSF